MSPRPPSASPQRVTLKSLAEQLNLSRTTISIVLNDAPQARTISPLTRDRILKAAAALQYRPNFLARSLHQGRSYLIGVISPDFSEGYTAGVLGGIERYLIDTNYRFFTASHYWSQERAQQNVQLFAERDVEGIIFINTPYAYSHSLPTVHIGHMHRTVPGSSIRVDNRLGIFYGLQHLVALGHRNIAFIRGHKGSVDSDDRWNAIRAVAKELSLTVRSRLVVQLERLDRLALSALEEGAYCAEQLFAQRGRFTALMCFNDMSAIGAINRFREAGWAVPGEVSVIGFDDVMESRISYPALTTIRQPLREMGEAAAKVLVDEITQSSGRRTVVFNPTLVTRQSTSSPQPSKDAPGSQ